MKGRNIAADSEKRTEEIETDKFTWGIMGLGRISELFAEAVNASEDTQFVCASRSEEKAAVFAEKYGAVKYYGSYEALAADENVNIVYIGTPTSCHCDNVRLCLESGRNVLCEKSVTINSAQWRELVSLAAEKGLFLMEAMWMKCLPSFLKAKEWIAQGRIGMPKLVKAELNKAYIYEEGDRLFKKELGGGVLLDMGVYVLTLACDILGYEPQEIHSRLSMGPSGSDFTSSIMLDYSDGRFADLTASFEMPSENYAYIVGTKGRIRLGPWFHCSRSALLTLNDGSEEYFDGSFICNGYEYEIAEARNCITSGLTQSRLVPISETTAVMNIMDEIRRKNGLLYEGVQFED